MHGVGLTRRGWAAVTIVAMIIGSTVGAVVSLGDDPCDWTVSTVECTR